MHGWGNPSKSGIVGFQFRPGRNWGSLINWLFWFNHGAASLLILLVLTTPWLIREDPGFRIGLQILFLFGHDPVVRRVSIASAIGLIVTACICYWPSRGQGKRPDRSRRRTMDPIAGA